jgi:hypothetical protein
MLSPLQLALVGGLSIAVQWAVTQEDFRRVAGQFLPQLQLASLQDALGLAVPAPPQVKANHRR